MFYSITGIGIMLGPIYSGYLAQWFGVGAAFTGYLPIITAALIYAAVGYRNYTV